MKSQVIPQSRTPHGSFGRHEMKFKKPMKTLQVEEILSQVLRLK